jgi:hypothetical protein
MMFMGYLGEFCYDIYEVPHYSRTQFINDVIK